MTKDMTDVAVQLLQSFTIAALAFVAVSHGASPILWVCVCTGIFGMGLATVRLLRA